MKELGLLGMNCECLAQDAQRLFDVYWYLSSPGDPIIPDPWPSQFVPQFNMESPAKINFGPNPGSAFWSVSECTKLFMLAYVQSFAGYVNGSKEWEWFW